MAALVAMAKGTARALADVEAADEAYFAPLGGRRAAFLAALSALPAQAPR